MSPQDLVFVVDDDPSLRGGLNRLFSSVGLAVHSYSNAREFLDAYRGEEPACLVLDVRMPGLSGLELQKQLAESRTGLPIIFLTGHGDIPMSVNAMKSGAVEFLTKPFRAQDLIDAVRHAIERHRVVGQERKEISELQERYGALTPRERDVMAGIVEGLRNKEIASALGTREATVKEQRAQVLQKMRVGSVAELVRIAARLSLPSSLGGAPTRRT